MTRAQIVALTLWVLPVALAGGAAGAAESKAPLSAGAYIISSGKVNVGDKVPPFRAKDIYGVEINLADLIASGRRPVLSFWSMYCQSCIEKFKAMVAVQAKYADRGLVVISVNTDGEYKKGAQAIRDFVADYERRNNFKVNFPVLYDERNWLPSAMGIEFLPTIVTVDPQERVAGYYQKFGEVSEAAILSGIDALARDLLARYETGTPVPVTGLPPSSDRK